MFDIKDLAGLSEPLKRLLDVVAEGIGGISRPLLTRTNANAKAYEIRTVAQAITDSQKLLGPIKYEEGNIVIESSPSQETLALPEADAEQRVLARIAYREARKQSNIENIVHQAADDLQSEQVVAPEKPDSDWITRFFNIAEDISTEHMQTLWGKILAGEVKKPGSYSLRTLELLKNINQREAELFVRTGKIAIATGDKVFIPNRDNGKYLEEKFGLSFADLLVLREIDLLVINDLELSLGPVEENTQELFTSGSTCVLVYRSKGTPKQALKCILFTEIGKQLLQLIEKSPADYDYIKYFASVWRRDGVEIKSGLFIERQNNNIEIFNLQEVPVESENEQNPDSAKK